MTFGGALIFGFLAIFSVHTLADEPEKRAHAPEPEQEEGPSFSADSTQENLERELTYVLQKTTDDNGTTKKSTEDALNQLAKALGDEINKRIESKGDVGELGAKLSLVNSLRYDIGIAKEKQAKLEATKQAQARDSKEYNDRLDRLAAVVETKYAKDSPDPKGAAKALVVATAATIAVGTGLFSVADGVSGGQLSKLNIDKNFSDHTALGQALKGIVRDIAVTHEGSTMLDKDSKLTRLGASQSKTVGEAFKSAWDASSFKSQEAPISYRYQTSEKAYRGFDVVYTAPGKSKDTFGERSKTFEQIRTLSGGAGNTEVWKRVALTPDSQTVSAIGNQVEGKIFKFSGGITPNGSNRGPNGGLLQSDSPLFLGATTYAADAPFAPGKSGPSNRDGVLISFKGEAQPSAVRISGGAVAPQRSDLSTLSFQKLSESRRVPIPPAAPKAPPPETPPVKGVENPTLHASTNNETETRVTGLAAILEALRPSQPVF